MRNGQILGQYDIIKYGKVTLWYDNLRIFSFCDGSVKLGTWNFTVRQGEQRFFFTAEYLSAVVSE